MVWSWTVPGRAGQDKRADAEIADALKSGLGKWEEVRGDPPAVSRSRVQALIEEGKVTVDGAPLKSNARLREGAVVRIDVPPPRPMTIQPADRPLDVLYEDEHLAVVNKPSGLTVHPTLHETEDTLVNRLLFHMRDLSGIGGVERPGIVHRIDKDTSGALLITKTDRAHHVMADVFARHAIERRYWALVYGAPAWPGPGSKPGEHRIEGTIGRNPNDRQKMAAGVEGGKKAVTLFRVQERYAEPGRNPFASLVEARLETGRTHQVRVHLTGAGHSLLGDPVYGTPTSRQTKWTSLPDPVQAAVKALQGQALHARVLGFDHPITGQPLRFEAPLPADFELLLQTLRKYGGT